MGKPFSSSSDEGHTKQEVKTPDEALKGLDYPVVEAKPQIMEVMRTHDNFVLVGETGSGKTTCLPFMLLEMKESLGLEGKIAVTQPRRVAARSVSKRVAELMNCRVGQEVGYQVRFEDQTSEGTEINFMTDGILLRKMQFDPYLKDYSIVMVDEAHERSLNIDLCLGLLRDVNERRSEAGMQPIRIAVTSATIEKDKFVQYFSNGDQGSSIEIPGRLYPVEVFYEEETPRDYTEAAAQKVKQIAASGDEGDILIFMPGKQEIDNTVQHIQELMGADVSKLDILSLHAEMTPEDQDRIFQPNGKRKVIVSTNIAETSITVPGVRHVIDSGLVKQVEFDARAGIEELVLKPHAQSGLEQRKGRAGRLVPGKCYRLFTEESFKERQKFQTPEIQRSELSHVILMMKKIGIEDVEGFDFVDPPERVSIHQAVETLKVLGALNETGKITKTGELMAELGLEPKIGRMVIEAQKYGCVEQICTIAAFLGNKSVFNKPREKEYEADRAHAKFRNPESDFLTLLNVWNAYTESHYSFQWARENFLNARTLEEAQKVRYELFRVLKRNGIVVSKNADPEAVGKSVTAGLVSNLMELTYNDYRRISDGYAGVRIGKFSVVSGGSPNLIVSANIMERELKAKRGGTFKGKFADSNQSVKPEWISEVAPQLCSETPRSVRYDRDKDAVVRDIEVSLKNSYSGKTLARKQELVEGAEATKVFAQALARGEVTSPVVEQNKQAMEKLNDLWRRAEGNI